MMLISTFHGQALLWGRSCADYTVATAKAGLAVSHPMRWRGWWWGGGGGEGGWWGGGEEGFY